MFMHGKLLTAAKTIKKIDKTVNLQVHLDVQVQLKANFHPFLCIFRVFLQYNMLDAILDLCGPACPQQNNSPAQALRLNMAYAAIT